MNLLSDESVDQPIVQRLRAEGFSVIAIAETSPGITDEEVLNRANAIDALLLTADKDFGELVFRQGRIHNGVVLVRLSGLSSQEKENSVAEVFCKHANELAGAFTVISPGMVRIRRRI